MREASGGGGWGWVREVAGGGGWGWYTSRPATLKPNKHHVTALHTTTPPNTCVSRTTQQYNRWTVNSTVYTGALSPPNFRFVFPESCAFNSEILYEINYDGVRWRRGESPQMPAWRHYDDAWEARGECVHSGITTPWHTHARISMKVNIKANFDLCKQYWLTKNCNT